MKLFECEACGQLLYFENTHCERCGRVLGYRDDRAALGALDAVGDGTWRPLADPESTMRFCANAEHDACNWLIPADGPAAFCRACRLNRTIPDLSEPRALMLWQRVEAAKHRLVYGLLRLGLPVVSRFDDPDGGLAFDFLSGEAATAAGGAPVITGHARGLITLDIAEADDAERERHRLDMAEPYRTLLGHFRHEVGHYYWERLIRGGVWHDAFREMFGDERQDYRAALDRYYAEGPPDDWRERFVSGYAAAHPWEDFAETWAHYLHIVDTLETAAAFGLTLRPGVGRQPRLDMAIGFDPYEQGDFDALVHAWQPLTAAINSLNLGMGQPDLYPFVLGPTTMGKLRFVHGLVHGPTRGRPA
ncbi:MAG: putative zinc-binding peptidase [Azospirillaceae bacterium]